MTATEPRQGRLHPTQIGARIAVGPCLGAALTVVALSDRMGARRRRGVPEGDGGSDGPADTLEPLPIGGTSSPF